MGAAVSGAVCHGCERRLFDAHGGPAVSFAAVVMTRSRPMPGVKAGGRFALSENACVCSRACLAKVKATWPFVGLRDSDNRPITKAELERQFAYTVDGEHLRIMWTIVVPDEPGAWP